MRNDLLSALRRRAFLSPASLCTCFLAAFILVAIGLSSSSHQSRFPRSGKYSVYGHTCVLMAAINPAELSELIFKAVHNAQPLTQTEYGERVKQLTQQISELSYVAAALVERVGGDHDVHAEPHHILGVRVEAMETAAA